MAEIEHDHHQATVRCEQFHGEQYEAVLRIGSFKVWLQHNEAAELHRQLDKILRDERGHIVTKPVLVTETPREQWEIDLLAEPAAAEGEKP